jgi:hypothetical protein
MRRVTFKSVLQKASALYLGNPTPNAATTAALNVHINKRASECWESFFWPEWTVTEARTFRNVWSAVTAYTAGTEVYYRPAKKYAVALTSSTGQAPFTLSGGVYVANTAYWAESQGSYSASDYSSTRTYVRGEAVYYPDTDKWYQLFAATSTGNAPTDTTKWGELVRFKRNIDLEQSWETNVIGEFAGIYDDHPELNSNAEEIPFTLGTSGAAIVAGTANIVYVRYRQRVSTWTGATFSSSSAYASGVTVYDDTLGDFYTSITSVSAGSSLTDTAKWTRVAFPYVFRDAVPQLAYADMLRGDGMNEKAALELAEGFRALRREFDKIERQQKQHKPLNVKTR